MTRHLAATIVAVALLLAGRANVTADRRGQDAMFSAADAYERFMGRWSRALAPQLVRFAEVRDGDRVLDVGSGTGALAAAIAAAAPSSAIVGIDPSAAYVASAEASRPNPHVTFEVGDAQQMRFDAASFTRTLSLLVVNFIPDAPKAVREMRRVTRPGGTVAAAVWDYGDGMEMLRVFWDAAITRHPADAAKDERHMRYCRRGELAELWRGAGLQDVREEGLTVETRFASFEDYWTPFTLKQGPAGAYVASLTPADRDALRDALRRRLLGDAPDRAITLHARAWAVRGVVP